MRYSESWGKSWRDPRQPGTRHWRGHRVSVGFGWVMLGEAVKWLVIIPIAFLVWAAFEVCALVCSALVALVAMAMYRLGPDHLRITRWAGLHFIYLKTT